MTIKNSTNLLFQTGFERLGANHSGNPLVRDALTVRLLRVVSGT
ncbi:hypothetical protein [Rhizobium sp. Root1204]|nr:hypothetical protein [Rhizobium sp. Root1204]